MYVAFFFFFKQKTAYELRISDWSSDVCSSDLEVEYSDSTYMTDLLTRYAVNWLDSIDTDRPFFLYLSHKANHAEFYPAKDRKSVVKGKSVSVRVDLGRLRITKKKKK